MRRTIIFFLTILVLQTGSASYVSAQEPDPLSCGTAGSEKVIETINSYGTLDRWSVREVKESGIIGGKVAHLFEFYGNQETVKTRKPFEAPEGYLWRTNNVLAVVAGVTKTSNTVYPEKRGDGYCARLETHMESVKVMGVINMDVTCQGACSLSAVWRNLSRIRKPR